jgi:hypothetical protein
MKDFTFLAANGNIGIYNKCEIIEIFGFDTATKQPFNIFTLAIFEDTKQIDIEELLTKKLEKFPSINNLKWGVKRRIVDIENVQTFFSRLKNEKKYTFGDKTLSSIGQLAFLDKQFIESNESLTNPQINNLLKNNFHNGSYLIEAFDETKEHVKFLLDDPVLLNNFSEQVSAIVPIKLANVSDRLGNIIFQFPINIFKLHHTLPRNPEGIMLDFCKHQRLKRKLKLSVIAQNTFDNTMLDFKSKMITKNDFIEISTSNNIDILIIDSKTDLVVYRKSFNTIDTVCMNMNLLSSQQRCFKIADKAVQIGVGHNSFFEVNGKQNKATTHTTWIRNRVYEQERQQLEKSKSFIQYFSNEQNKALNDIRTLISQNGQNGVYLWDPYLSAVDIKQTLYYSPFSNVILRAITGLKQHNNNSQAISDMQNEFNQDDRAYLLLNLEVRGKNGNYGHDFHDRFIIFPSEQPRVWSLGISVNQLGESHHILHEVKNAQHIVNAFNALWDALNHKECIVWKSI